MTYQEFKTLAKELSETDSKTRESEIREKIFIAARKVLIWVCGTYSRFGRRYVDDSDFQLDKGHLCLDDDYGFVHGDKVNLRYWDHWRYGGECDIGIDVDMTLLDPKNRIKLRNSLAKQYIKVLENNIKDNNRQITYLQTETQKLSEKLENLKKKYEGV
jgi:hypothetical protein